MVFYLPPKRQRQHRKPGGRISITELADEMVLHIIECGLTIPDILRLRMSHPSFTPACATVLAKRIHRLYIHPCHSSLKAAVDICNHPVLGQEIDEAVLLGKVLWRDIERAWPGYRHLGQDAVALERENNERFRPWPPLHPAAMVQRSVGKKGATIPGVSGVAFESAYHPLIDALANLPCLKRISFAEQVDKPCWNYTSQVVVDALAKKTAAVNLETRSNRRILARKDDASDLSSQGTRWSDADVFFNIFFHPRLHFSEMALTSCELPFVSGWEHRIATRSTPADLAFPCEKVAYMTSLDLHLDRGWSGTKWQELCQALLLHAENLQHLRLLWRPNAALKRAKDENAFWEIALNGHAHAHLKTLELIALPAESDVSIQRPPRPICFSTTDFAGLLRQNAATLERVSFSNVLFCCRSAQSSVTRTTHDVLDAVNECNTLQHVVWSVDHFEHDERCKAVDGQTVLACKFDCGVYCDIDRGLAKLENVQALAQKLDVHLDEKGRVWDFGEYSRRQQKQRADHA